MVGLIKKWFSEIDDWWFYRNRKDKSAIVKMIVNKQLKPFNVDYDYVIKNPKINGIDWYIYYTFNNEKDYNKWREYSIKLIKKHITNDQKMAEKEFSWIDLYCGLKHNYNENRNKI